MLKTPKTDVREKNSLPPSHKAWISDFPYTSPLVPSISGQDVSSPLVIWITLFSLRDICSNALSRDVLTWISLPISDKDIACASLENGSWHGIIRHTHTPQKVICNSSLRHITSQWYPVFLQIRIAPLYLHSHKFLYEVQARIGGIYNHLGIPYFRAHVCPEAQEKGTVWKD